MTQFSVNHQEALGIFPKYQPDSSGIISRRLEGRPVSNSKMIRIIVQDAEGQRVPDAMISIRRAPAPPPDLTAFVDDSGETMMKIQAIGQYEFVCSADSYENATITAMITETPVSLVMIVLRPDM